MYETARTSMINASVDSDPADAIEQLGELTGEDWLWAAGLTVASVLLAVVVFRVVHRFAQRHLVPFVAKLIARLAALVVFVVGFFYAMQQVGVSLAPFLGVVGLLGLALALSFQDVLENFIAGVFLSARRPFSQGDEVTSGGHTGRVEEINLRELTLTTFDGERVIIPNATVWQNPIVNHTANPSRRTTLEVGVAYKSDLEAVRTLLMDTVTAIDGVHEEPAPQVFAHSFGASSVDFAIRFWHTSTIGDEWSVRDAVLRAVFSDLREAGIEIPFPQRVVEILDSDS